jgi:dipeptidyl aminopeptidase/acylaminoacyl peptidase
MRGSFRRPGLGLRTALALSTAALVLNALLVVAAHAQYFGQNKVRYRTFDFQLLKTTHFDIYYYPEETEGARDVAVMAERWYGRLSKSLDHQLDRRQPLILYASHPEFEQTNAIPGDLGEGTGGVTEFLKRRIVLPLAGPPAETDHVVGHELVHAFQFDIVGRGGQSIPGLGGDAAQRLPLWFMEGMAEYLSVGPVDPHTAMWMRDAANANKLPSYQRLSDPRYFPYRFGQALFAYIAGRWGEKAVGEMLKAARGNGDATRAIRGALGVGPDTLVIDWHQAIRAWSKPIEGATEPASKAAQPLLAKKRGGGHLNLAPALSPDGNRVAFFSEKSLFSIELYIADARTGKIERTLTKTAVDQHFQSLQFINSAGAWSADGTRLAFAAVSRGHPILSVLVVATGKVEREIPFPDLGEILTPTWAPDGKRIAFSALQGGFADLWVVDLESGQARRLTQDKAADLAPAWSPDGRNIAFVTDRFSAEPGQAEESRYRLALVNPESGEIRPVRAWDKGKHIDPQWSADAKTLYFISDHDGISNLYRVPAEGGDPVRLTNLLTGASGITALSPALSVARDGSRLVFNAYEKSDYNLYAIESPGSLPPKNEGPPAAAEASRLPTGERRREGETPTAYSPPGLVPDTLTIRPTRYRSKLSLDYVGQAGLGVGAASSGGVAFGGGAALFWSDMLGNHNLVTMLQANNAGGSTFNNLAAGVGYENLRSRWTWGGEASQFPYLTTSFVEDDTLLDGVAVIRDRTFRLWQVNRTVAADLSYPFNRFQRIEFTGGYRHISFAREVETQNYSALTGFLLTDENQSQPSEQGSLNLGIAGGALVYDSAIFGGTSPVLGQSYRLGTTLVAGSLLFEDVTADYRRYVMPIRPLTLAGRLLHFGRYGRDGESDRLSELFVGYPWLVRGYNDASFSIQECIESGGNGVTCPTFDRLLGSKLAVANFELRLPLLGGLGVIPSAGFLPIESAWFFDSGVAWTDNDKPSFLGGDRKAVTSTGLAMRVNLFGFAVGEMDLVHPNDRPGKGWYWQFALQPGF